MEKSLILKNPLISVKEVIIDLTLLTFIYLVPAISHLLALPLYYFEPMRIAIVLALIHTTKRNTYLIAFTLPIFAFVVSSHPSLLKTSLLTIELLLNVFIYYLVVKYLNNKVYALVVSIISSKIIYYALKFMFISFALLEGDLIATPFYYQIGTLAILTSYIYFQTWFSSKENGNVKRNK